MLSIYDTELDVRHEESPVPTILAKSALDKLLPNQLLKLVTGKPSTVDNIRTLVKNNPYELISLNQKDGIYEFIIKKIA